MAGNKTHEQQIAIIEKRVDTSNGGEAFDAEADLKLTDAERAERDRGRDLDASQRDLVDTDDREMLRGENQESEHAHKRADK